MKTSFKALISLCFFTLGLSVPGMAEEQPLNGIKNSLIVYVYPPRQKLNWSSPKSILFSFAKMAIAREILMNSDVKFKSDEGEDGSISSDYLSTMGHTLNHIQCTLPNGERFDRWTSFSGQNFSEVDKRLMLTEKRGMGSLFYNFNDGHIISGAENYERIVYYKGRSFRDADGSYGTVRPRYIQYEVDAKRCLEMKKMVGFFESFRFNSKTTLVELEAKERANPENVLYFTNQIDPYDSYKNRMKTGRGIVGGGCAPYAVALVKAAGHFSGDFENYWILPIQVSERLIGGYDPVRNENRQVSVKEIALGKLGDNWTYPGYNNRPFNQYDPQKIWDFTGQVLFCLTDGKRGCSQSVDAWLSTRDLPYEIGETKNFDAVLRQKTFTDGEVLVKDVHQPVKGVFVRLK
ncbi:MAG: hypothetical protein AB7O96_05900 [Pseudobdellovibrionaceae bacterium]